MAAPVLGVVFLLGLLASCAGETDRPTVEHRGPIVLLTLNGLRADHVGAVGGEPGWTPEIDRFAEQADWVGRAVTSSSSPIPAMVSFVTGVDPWQHGVLSHLFHQKRRDLPTLAEMLGRAGYSTRLIAPRDGMAQFGGYGGYQSVDSLTDLETAAKALRELRGGPEHIWVHLPFISLPYRDRRQEVPSLAELAAPSREVVGRIELLRYADPNRSMPTGLESAAQELYRHEVARADFQIGRLLRALDEGGLLSRSFVVVTALHGTELGEHGQTLFAQNLSRETIEVPLIVFRPKGLPPLQADSSLPVAQTRIAATLAEAAGAESLPVQLPGLNRRTELPILSSLYLHDAKNRFAVVSIEGGQTTQLTVEVPFAGEEPRFFEAQVLEAQNWGRRAMAQQVRNRLLGQFKRSPPFSGALAIDRGQRPRADLGFSVTLEKWIGASGVEPLSDPELQERLLRQLETRWSRFVDDERTPEEERRRWSGQ